MIHELKNTSLNNHWENKIPVEDDFVIAIKEDKFLLYQDNDTIRFPFVKHFNKEECLYLFSLDNHGFFLYCKQDIPQIENTFYSDSQIFREKKLTKALSFAGITALHLIDWYKNNQFCGKCGTKTIHSTKERMLECPQCNNMIYPKISPAVIVAVTDKDKLLMSKYANRKNGKYILLAGFAEIGETLEETCYREVLEETGIHIRNIRYYRSQPWGFSNSLLTGFFAEASSTETIKLDDEELSEACWIERKDIDSVDEDFSLTNAMIMAFKDERF